MSEEPKPYTCKHGCERDQLKDEIYQLTKEVDELRYRLLAEEARIARLEAELAGAREVLNDVAKHCPQCDGEGEYPFGSSKSMVPCEFCETARAALAQERTDD